MRRVFDSFPDVQVAVVFGSASRGQLSFTSDLDLAVATRQPLAWREKMRLMEALALAVLRPIDLVDLQSAHGLILRRALTTGSMLFCHDHGLYARVLSRMLFEEADFGPLVQAMREQRRRRWIPS
ncbi:MAG: type VII toxin-antitoxin system MntA family adenylyltransferase antitoxin [Limisphaerales bacterium]